MGWARLDWTGLCWTVLDCAGLGFRTFVFGIGTLMGEGNTRLERTRVAFMWDKVMISFIGTGVCCFEARNDPFSAHIPIHGHLAGKQAEDRYRGLANSRERSTREDLLSWSSASVAGCKMWNITCFRQEEAAGQCRCPPWFKDPFCDRLVLAHYAPHSC
jgi:hypothetical protein